MKLQCELIEKTFKDKDGIERSYYVLAFPLFDNSKLEVTIKGDKAKLLKLSNSMNEMPTYDKEIWENR